jgi:predicted phosphodiesterase
MLAVLSDIHGNLPALEAVVADAERRGCSAFVNLGDIVSGPLWPAETADYLNEREWPTIRGNHERQLLAGDADRMIPSDAYAFACLSDRHLAWLLALPETMKLENGVFLCHGSPSSDLVYLMEHVDEAGLRRASDEQLLERLGDRREKIVFCGHTHLPRVAVLGDGRLVANPGSVGLAAYEEEQPVPHRVEAGSPHARYAMLDEGRVTLFAVDYDHGAAADRASLNGRPDWAYALANGRMS